MLRWLSWNGRFDSNQISIVPFPFHMFPDILSSHTSWVCFASKNAFPGSFNGAITTVSHISTQRSQATICPVKSSSIEQDTHKYDSKWCWRSNPSLQWHWACTFLQRNFSCPSPVAYFKVLLLIPPVSQN